MVLNSENRVLPVPYPFDGPVVEVKVRDLKRLRTGHAARIAAHREPMVLRRYKYLSRTEIPHRVVTAAVPIGEFDRLSPKGEAQKLVPQANAESGEA